MNIYSLFAPLKKEPDTISLIEDPKKFFEMRIFCGISEYYPFSYTNRALEDELNFCGSYAALILAEAISKDPEKFTATDYFFQAQESSPRSLEGAKACFLLCSVFRDNKLIKRAGLNFYIRMGTHMFFKAHAEYGFAGCFLMASHYDTMADIVGKSFCLKKSA